MPKKLLSFEEDEQEEEFFQIKKDKQKFNVDLGALKTLENTKSVSYDDEIAKLKLQSKLQTSKKKMVPDRATIESAKLRRAEKAKQNEEFIPLNDEEKTENNSRLHHEETEELDIEIFDDYEMDALAFGHEAVKTIDRKKKAAMKEQISQLADMEDVSEEEEFKEWEKSQIAKGMGQTIRQEEDSGFSYAKLDRKFKMIPEILQETMTIESILVETERRHKNMDLEKQNMDMLETHYHSQIEEYHLSEKRIADEITQLSSKHAFFLNIQTFVQDLASLMDSKIDMLKTMERQKTKSLVAQAKRHQQDYFQKLEGSLSHFCIYRPETFPELNAMETDLDESDILHDVNEEYTQEKIVDKFKEWKTQYPQVYGQVYGDLSLVFALELYIRMENVSVIDFSEKIEFESLDWHQLLVECVEDVESSLKLVIDKFVIPRVVLLISEGAFNLLSSDHAKSFQKLFSDLRLYVDADHLKTLQATLYSKCCAFVRETLDKYNLNKMNGLNRDHQEYHVQKWYSLTEQLFTHVLHLEKLFTSEELLELVHLILNWNIPLFNVSESFSDISMDIKLLESLLSRIPETCFMNDFQVSNELLDIEQCLLIFFDRLSNPDLKKRIVDLLVKIHSFENAAKLNKLIQ